MKMFHTTLTGLFLRCPEKMSREIHNYHLVIYGICHINSVLNPLQFFLCMQWNLIIMTMLWGRNDPFIQLRWIRFKPYTVEVTAYKCVSSGETGAWCHAFALHVLCSFSAWICLSCYYGSHPCSMWIIWLFQVWWLRLSYYCGSHPCSMWIIWLFQVWFLNCDHFSSHQEVKNTSPSLNLEGPCNFLSSTNL